MMEHSNIDSLSTYYSRLQAERLHLSNDIYIARLESLICNFLNISVENQAVSYNPKHYSFSSEQKKELLPLLNYPENPSCILTLTGRILAWNHAFTCLFTAIQLSENNEYQLSQLLRNEDVELLNATIHNASLLPLPQTVRLLTSSSGKPTQYTFSKCHISDMDETFYLCHISADDEISILDSLPPQNVHSAGSKRYEEMYHLLRLMCDNVPEMIWAKDLENKYIFANKSISEKLLNAADTNEAVGKTDDYFIQREQNNYANNPNWHTFGALINETDSIVIHDNKVLQYEESGFIKGSFCHFEVFKAPFYDRDGSIAGTLGSARDVTRERWLDAEHEKTLKALTMQSERLKAVINVMPDLLFILNTEGDFIDFFANDETNLLVDPNQIKNTNIRNVFSPEEVDRQLTIYKQCVDTKSTITFEYQIAIANKIEDFEARITPLHDDKVLAIIRDITQKKNTEYQLQEYTRELLSAKEKAEKSDQLKTSFLANMSHEIRTPMNSIMGFADLLSDPELEPELRQQYTQIIINRSEDLLQIINDVLDISRIESGNAALNFVTCDINKLIEQLHTNISSKLTLIPTKTVEIINYKAFDSGPWMISTDELKLKQILVNLLDNALKFTDKGSIKFGYTMPETGYITFFVSDTGLGIEPEYQQVIFERFRQAEISDRNKYKGTGLGLAICKGNAELLNGSLWMESIPGKGSTFYCRLPYNPVTISASTTTKKSILYRFDWKEKLVVIVEDDEQNTRYLQTVLRKTGVKIKYARDGVAFREILSYQPSIDVILMDIQLPGEDGWQLTKYSKSVNPQIPIIAQTAFGLESDRKKSMDAGCDSFIAKPITPDELLSTLALYLGN